MLTANDRGLALGERKDGMGTDFGAPATSVAEVLVQFERMTIERVQHDWSS